MGVTRFSLSDTGKEDIDIDVSDVADHKTLQLIVGKNFGIVEPEGNLFRSPMLLL
jgi:hypothetical protein